MCESVTGWGTEDVPRILCSRTGWEVENTEVITPIFISVPMETKIISYPS